MEGENSKQLNAYADAPNDGSKTYRTLFSLVNADHGTDSRTHSENLEGNGHVSAKNSDTSDAISLSWSNSFSDGSFQVNPQFPKTNQGTKPACKSHKVNVSSEALYRSEESISDSRESTSQTSVVSHESLVPCFSSTKSPPLQVMERTGSFDPNRIPASSFARSSTTMNWSITSNESLFSINLEKDSFSGELLKSGELIELHQFGELCNSDDQERSGELIRLRQTSITSNGLELDQKVDTTTVVDETNSDFPEACINTRSGTDPEVSGSSTANCCSNGSETEIESTGLPKKEKSACPFCYCSYCSTVHSCCKRPSCCCKWSICSCNCFSQGGCSCNWSYCSSCCCKWPKCSFKRPRCHCKCPSLLICKCCSSNSSWSCCQCWKRGSKVSHTDSFNNLMESG